MTIVDGAGPANDLAGLASVTFSGSGFGAHNGKVLHVKIEDPTTKPATIVQTGTATIQQGSFSFQWNGLFKQLVYYGFYYYIDDNGNDSCEAPPTDGVWMLSVLPMSTNTQAMVTPSGGGALAGDFCSKFQ